MNASIQIARLVAVLALLCAAAAIATPKGRLPLALRGVAKLFKIQGEERTVPLWKRLLACVLVAFAVLLSIL